MKRILTTLALLALPLAAQDAKQDLKPEPPRVQKLFVLKYAEPDQIRGLISSFGNVSTNSQMHALTVSATPEAMTVIEDAIKTLDVPSAGPRNVELTAYLLIGSQAENATAASLPKDLDSVVTQLRTAFAYKNYGLMDVLSLRTRTAQQQGGSQTVATGEGGSAQIDNNLRQINTDLRIRSVDVAADGTVRINGLSIQSKVFGSNDTANIITDLDLKEGQKVVVGKTGLSPNAAIFVVLTAHLAQ